MRVQSAGWSYSVHRALCAVPPCWVCTVLSPSGDAQHPGLVLLDLWSKWLRLALRGQRRGGSRSGL